MDVYFVLSGRGEACEPKRRGNACEGGACAGGEACHTILDVDDGRADGVEAEPHAVARAVIEAFVPGAAGYEGYVVDEYEPAVARLEAALHTEGDVFATSSVGGEGYEFFLPGVDVVHGEGVDRCEVVVAAQGAVAYTHDDVGAAIGSTETESDRHGGDVGHVHSRSNDHGVVVAVVVAAAVHAQGARRTAVGVAHYLRFVECVVVVEQFGPAGRYDVVTDAVVVEALLHRGIHGAAGGAERLAGSAAWRPVVGDAADGEVVVGVGIKSSEREGVGVHCRDVSVEAHHEGT